MNLQRTYYLRSWTNSVFFIFFYNYNLVLKWHFYFNHLILLTYLESSHIPSCSSIHVSRGRDHNNQIVPISRFLSTFDEWASYLGCVSGHLVFAWLESGQEFLPDTFQHIFNPSPKICVMRRPSVLFTYRKVASSNTSCLEAHLGFFWLLMKGIFDAYVLWPFGNNIISELVKRVNTRVSTVYVFLMKADHF